MGRNFPYPPRRLNNSDTPIVPSVRDDAEGNWYEKPNWGGERLEGMSGFRFQNVDPWAYPFSLAQHQTNSDSIFSASNGSERLPHKLMRNYEYTIGRPLLSNFFRMRVIDAAGAVVPISYPIQLDLFYVSMQGNIFNLRGSIQIDDGAGGVINGNRVQMSMACRVDFIATPGNTSYHWYIPREWYNNDRRSYKTNVNGLAYAYVDSATLDTDRFSTLATTTKVFNNNFAWIGNITTNPISTDLNGIECLNIELGREANFDMNEIRFELQYECFDLRANRDGSSNGMAVEEQTLQVRGNGSTANAVQPGEYGATDHLGKFQ